MRKFWTILSGALVIVFLAGSGGQEPKVQTASAPPSSISNSAALKIDRDFGKMDAQVAYYLQGKDKTIYFTSEGLTYVLSERSAGEQTAEKTASVKERLLINPAEREVRNRRDERRYAVKLDFVGANADVRPSGEEKTGASSITAVQTYGSFETAGITIRVDGMDFDETATVEYKRSADPDYQNGHDFVRYDGNHMATSLFRLESNTTYDVRVTLIDPDGVTGANPVVTSVSTRPDYSLPAPLRVVTVSTQTELNTAAAAAQPGDEIRMAAGTYPDGIAVSGRTGSEGHPIVVTSQTGTRPLLQGDADGGVTIEHSAYWVLDNLEVHNEEGDGIQFRGCHSMVIRRCYVHDSRPGDYTNNVFICHGEESDPPYAGNYLIEHNVISDEVHDSVDENQGPGESNTNVAGQSYFGIHLDYQPGGFVTIRGNTIYGTVDGIHPTGDEGESPVMGPDDLDVLDSWHDQNLDLYDNVIYDCKDDAIECDGHMVNGRIFRNRLGKCENAVSTAPFYPGPLFVVRNFIHGFHQGCFKQNTGVDGVTRKVHFYHNTVREKQRASPQHCGSEYCLYRGEPSYQQSFVYLNNIFFGRGRVYNGDLYDSGQYHRYDTFDYNLIYSTRQTDPTYACKWVCQYGDPLNNTTYVDLASFRASVGQELHGLWGDPRLDTTLLSGYPEVSKLLDLKILAGSPAIDHGLPIPGINDGFLGTAPDIGAFEFDSAIDPPSPPANPYPANGATGVVRDPTLTWSSTAATAGRAQGLGRTAGTWGTSTGTAKTISSGMFREFQDLKSFSLIFPYHLCLLFQQIPYWLLMRT